MPVDGGPLGALAHGREPQVRPVGDEGGEDGLPVRARPLTREGAEGRCEAAPVVDLAKQVLDADPGQGCVDGAAQIDEPRRDLQGVPLAEPQACRGDRREGVFGEARGQGLGSLPELLAELAQERVRLTRELEDLMGER